MVETVCNIKMLYLRGFLILEEHRKQIKIQNVINNSDQRGVYRDVVMSLCSSCFCNYRAKETPNLRPSPTQRGVM